MIGSTASSTITLNVSVMLEPTTVAVTSTSPTASAVTVSPSIEIIPSSDNVYSNSNPSVNSYNIVYVSPTFIVTSDVSKLKSITSVSVQATMTKDKIIVSITNNFFFIYPPCF